LRLLNLQIIDHSSYALHYGGIAGSSRTFSITGDVAAQRNHASGRLYLYLAALNGGIAIKLALHIAGYLRIGADWSLRTRGEEAQHQREHQEGMTGCLGLHNDSPSCLALKS